MRAKYRLNRDELYDHIIKKLALPINKKAKTKKRFAYLSTDQMRLLLEYVEKNEGKPK